MSAWIYRGKEINPEVLDNNKAFVYVITNEKNKKRYFGKKKLQFHRSKKIPGRKNRIRFVKESDWRDYWGSNKQLHEDLDKYGKENFTREILRICKTLGEASYYEAKLQFEHNVLLHPDKFYNTFIGCRINRMHLKIDPE